MTNFSVVIMLLVQLILVIVSVAIFTLEERKILGYVQSRKGPNKPGPIGLLVPFADAIKLLRKENNRPARRNFFLFVFCPCLTLLLPICLWVVYPSKFQVLFFSYSALWFICVSAVGVYAMLGAGWRGNRKYSILGAVRSVSQSISYEVCLTLIMIHCFIYYSYAILNIKYTPLWTFLFLVILLLLISAFAETNRTPFDLSEGESELVSGFNTEFSSVPFVILFLAEYISIIFVSCVLRMLFAMTSFLDLFVFLVLYAAIVIWSRCTLPRFRFDQLIYLAWKTFLPAVICTLAVCIVS